MESIQSIMEFINTRTQAETKRMEILNMDADPGFNSFFLVSDIYYRENFHSDVLAAILNPISKHEADNKYLHLFIDWINSIIKNEKPNYVPINKYDYSIKSIVTREIDRIDVAIKSTEVDNKHAIIIENKINDAIDTTNQLPAYYKKLEAEGFKIDAIVYLTLNQTKEPDYSTWSVTEDEEKKIKEKLILVRAFNGQENDFCNGWLKKCIESTTHIDALSILRQYLKLIKYLTKNHMDHEYMNNLYKDLKENINVQVLISIQKAANDLPWFISTLIYKKLESKKEELKFNSIQDYQLESFIINTKKIGNCFFVFEFLVNPDLESSKITFSSRNPDFDEGIASRVLEQIGYLDQFTWNNNGKFEYQLKSKFSVLVDVTFDFIKKFLESYIEEIVKIENILSIMK